LSIVSGGAFGFASAAIYRAGDNRGYNRRIQEEHEFRLQRLEKSQPDEFFQEGV
jgi:hypothetical protein